ncbi:hypothetical protein MTP99_005280 [Tenebrio molitor]|nr:hypothetical protein MTP99_005280 [Tenebrio molitor]CAH1381284.1 unnamed protein product [Tenebrio molitor]
MFGKGILLSVISLIDVLQIVASIDCFKCVSINHDYMPCEDPFHNNYTLDVFESPCMGGRKGRDGLFPATACIKITGIFDDNGDTITVRGCALDSGTLTTDTEIVRMSHCGGFFYDNRYHSISNFKLIIKSPFSDMQGVAFKAVTT